MCKVVFNITQGWAEDEARLSSKDKEEIKDRLNHLGDIAKKNKWKNQLFRLKGLSMPIPKNKSKLYLYSINKNINAVVAYDYDLLFNQRIISLYRVIPKSDSIKAFNSTALNLYV